MNQWYKKIFVAVLFTCALASAFAQTTTTWDSTYRVKSAPEKLKAFAADPVKPGDIVFLGNSITAGNDWGKLLNLPNAKQRGISGDITFGVLDRLDEIIAGKPAKVFVLIGINDISRNIPDEVIIRNHKRIVQRFHTGSPETKVYFYTLLPVNASFEKFKNHYGKDEHILAVNKAVKKLKKMDVTVIDLYKHFTDKDKHLKAELTKDGLHLIPAGYEVWKKVLEDGGYLK